MTEKDNNDCYAAQERAVMVWWQNVRETCLSGLLKRMDNKGVTPNRVTLLSFTFGLIAAICLPFNQPLALVLLFIHLLLDGLDGPLARYQNTASASGSMTDSMADQTIITFVLIALMVMNVVGKLTGGLCIFFYTLVVIFAMIRNRMKIPYSFLIRPRIVLYSWLVLEFSYLPGTMPYLVWSCNIVLIIHTIRGFFKIRESI